jgi:hypothetical protein
MLFHVNYTLLQPNWLNEPVALHRCTDRAAVTAPVTMLCMPWRGMLSLLSSPSSAALLVASCYCCFHMLLSSPAIDNGHASCCRWGLV